MQLNEEQKIILKRAQKRLFDLSKIALKKDEKIARELDEEAVVIWLILKDNGSEGKW